MNAFDALLDTPFAYHLGWTLVHFLWQGLLVGAAYAGLRPFMAQLSPQMRYGVSLGLFGLLAFLPVVTFIYLLGSPVTASPATGVALGTRAMELAPQATLFDSLRTALHPLVPWTVPAWCIGVALMALKSFSAWRRVRRLTREAAEDAPEAWQETVARLAMRIGVRVRVRLIITAKVAVPCVVGWLKPVILLPPAAMAGLTPLQLEMVLAHELSHIRRYDYLVNLVQVAVETLLFYHPVVRWISHDLRRERELCCDDSAVLACGDALHYAHALTDLEALRAGDLSPALGVNGGDLVMRVERLITPHHALVVSVPRYAGLMLASALCLGGLLALASARNLPLPGLQTFAFTALHPRSAGTADADRVYYRPAPRLALTALSPARQRVVQQMALDAVVPVEPVALTEVIAPAPLTPAVSEPVQTAQIGGAPIASVLPYAPSAASAIDFNKRAPAQMQIITMNHQDDAAARNPQAHHEYCEPITGSRVCSQ